MTISLLAGVALLIISLWLANWFANTQPSLLAAMARYAGGGLAGAFGLLLLARGQVGLGLVLLGSAGALLFRPRKPGPRKTSSEIETAFLRLRLDHETGALAGEVLAGRHAGRLLAGMSDEELGELRQDLEGDAESVRLFESYIERMRADGGGAEGTTDEGAASGSGRGFPQGGRMTREEALEVLGLSGDPTEAEIRHAHRTLIRKVHPDHGGSSYLASQLNAARDRLIAKKS